MASLGLAQLSAILRIVQPQPHLLAPLQGTRRVMGTHTRARARATADQKQQTRQQCSRLNVFTLLGLKAIAWCDQPPVRKTKTETHTYTHMHRLHTRGRLCAQHNLWSSAPASFVHKAKPPQHCAHVCVRWQDGACKKCISCILDWAACKNRPAMGGRKA